MPKGVPLDKDFSRLGLADAGLDLQLEQYLPPICVVQPTGEITYITPQARVLLALSPDKEYPFLVDVFGKALSDTLEGMCSELDNTESNFKLAEYYNRGQLVHFKVSLHPSCNLSSPSYLVQLTPGDPLRTLSKINEIRKIEEETVAKDIRYHTIFENSTDGMLLVDAETGKALDCNRRFTELFGTTKDSILSGNAADFSPRFQPNGIESDLLVRENIKQLRMNPAPLQFEWRYKNSNGKEFDAEIIITSHTFQNRNVWLNVIRDISTRKKLQNAIDFVASSTSSLGESDKYISQLLAELSKISEVKYVLLGLLQPCNMEVASSHFIEHGNVVPNFSFKLKDTPSAHVIDKGQICTFSEKLQDHFPKDVFLQDQNITSYIGAPLTNSEGETIGVLGLLHDLPLDRLLTLRWILRIFSSRIQAEISKGAAHKKLELSESQKKALLNAMPDRKYRIARDGTLLDVMFGSKEPPISDIPLDQLPGTNLSDISPKHLLSKYMETISLALDTGDVHTFEFEIETTHEGLRYYEARCNAINDEEAVVILRDISQLQNARNEIGQQLKALSQKNLELQKYTESNLELEHFAFVVSHDLREPLRTINGFAQLLERHYHEDLDQRATEYLDFIKTGVQDMDALIHGLLQYSRVNTSDSTFEWVDIKSLIQGVTQSLDGLVRETNAVIHLNTLPEKLPAMKLKIKQLFQNLIANALKFSRKGVNPVIHIHGGIVGDFWQFAVSDNGIGIKDEYFDQIFLIFKKLHTTREFPGTGIGLALCKRIVEQHNGNIWLESKPGEGTTFYFTISRKLVDKLSD